MESIDYLRNKYNDIMPRSFSTKLDIFLFDRAIRTKNLSGISPDEFERFQISDEIAGKYQKAWQLQGTEALSENELNMDQIDNLIGQWNDSQTKLKLELQRQYKILFTTDYFPFVEFERIYDPDPKKRICYYCKISDGEISKLRSRGKIYSKVNRGYTMEIDRLMPNHEYSKKNCVLACYWCNNAKSDEFTSGEFSEHIGPGIEFIWGERNS